MLRLNDRSDDDGGLWHVACGMWGVGCALNRRWRTSAGRRGRQQPGVKLKVSTDYGGSFVDACFPELFTERGYSVVYANDHTAFMNVDYNSVRAPPSCAPIL